MSRSYRTQKEPAIAERRIERNKNGNVVLPRIIERRPAHGDIHPLSKSKLKMVLKNLPVEYLYGLNRIEIRARNGSIGKPFGYYSRDEKSIVLNSLPVRWELDFIDYELERSLHKYHAKVESIDRNYLVTWPEESIMSLWFYCYVVAHELGHHYVEQYRTKNGNRQSLNHHEIVADLHSFRLTDDLFNKLRKKK